MANELLEAALAYASRGWRVIPLHTPIDAGTPQVRCSCRKGAACGRDTGKHPRLNDWTQVASADPATIEAWWRMWPDANVGLACGAELVVIDVDPRNGGDVAFEEFLALHPLPPHPISDTGGGGQHHCFAGRRGLAKGKLGPGIDLQAEGSLIVAPPSLHFSGRRYEWNLDSDLVEDLPPLPDLNGHAPKAEEAPAAPARELDLEPAREGGRNNKLAGIAAQLFARGRSLEEVLLFARGWAAQCSPPLSATEAEKTVRSIHARDRRQHPERHAPAVDISGLEAQRAATATSSSSALPRPKFEWVPIGTLTQRRRRSWLVKGLVARASLNLIYGPASAGKTPVTMDLCMHLALGQNWLGHRTRQSHVAYLAAEDAAGVEDRALAWHGGDQAALEAVRSWFTITESPCALQRAQDVADLLQSFAASPPDLLVVDTLAMALTGADENSAKEMGVAIANVKRIRDELGCAIWLVHHPGKHSDLARGSSALLGALDLEIHATPAPKDGRMFVALDMTKNRNAERLGKWATLELHVVQLGVDEDGDAITSVRAGHADRPGGKKPEPADENLGRRRAAVVQLLARMPDPLTSAAFAAALKERSNIGRSNALEAIKTLVEQGFVTRDTRGKNAYYTLNREAFEFITSNASNTRPARVQWTGDLIRPRVQSSTHPPVGGVDVLDASEGAGQDPAGPVDWSTCPVCYGETFVRMEGEGMLCSTCNPQLPPPTDGQLPEMRLAAPETRERERKDLDL